MSIAMEKQNRVIAQQEGAAIRNSDGAAIRKILIFGAGVLGSLYAGKLSMAGYDVTLLARGARLGELREHGLVLIESETGKIIHKHIPLTEHLLPEDAYDLVLVVVRKNQLPSVLPSLAANHCTPNLLFLVNNAAGPQQITDVLGRDRVLLGFPGGGGERSEGIVRYKLAGKAQPTTIGELDGRLTPRLKQIAACLQSAGLPVAICSNMDAWLKTHVALVSPVANALYSAGGSNYRLARTRDGLILLVRAVREGLRVLHALNIPIQPARYRLLEWIPEPLLIPYLRRGLATPQAELALSRHANAARDEMQQLADDFRDLARQTRVPTPAMEILYSYLDSAAPTLPEGQAGLRLEMRQTVIELGLLTALGLAAAWLIGRRK